MWLNQHDDAGWRALARNSGVSEQIARLLWKRAEADANHDQVKAERAFRRLLEDAKALDLLALELVANHRAGAEPGRSTRVLAEEQRHSGTTAEPPAQDASMSPATRLRQALEAAIQRGESVARTIAASDAKTITEALRRLGNEPGSPLAAIDPGSLAQLLRLADALVTLVEQGRSAGKNLPGGLRGELESRIGADLGDLRIHDDAAAASEASRHNAVAFAQGTDVFFADGMYDPSSAAGRQLIAHEATHVVQQRGGGRAASGAMSEPGGAVEREADRVASAFAAGFAPGAREFAVSERAAAGTISRKATTNEADPAAAPAGPTEWKPTLLGQTLDLSAKLAGARDVGGGQKQIDINQTIGPLRIQSAKFKANGDKVESGTLVASVDSGVFKGTTGSLTVNASGQVSGKLTVPVNTPGLFVKQISVDIGPDGITGKAKLSPGDFAGPDFPIKTSDFELTVTSSGSGVSAKLAGSAQVGIDNGMAQGQAKMDVVLKADSTGVTFDATIKGKITIAGIAEADATLTYDGKTVQITAGGTIPVDLPGIEGTANIHYEKGKLSLDSKDLHFTLPQLAPIKFDEVQASQSKLAAKLHLGSPISVPLPGGASLTLEQSTIAIDGKNVSGDITGTFALNNQGGLAARVRVAYDKGQIKGTVDISGGAKFNLGGVDITIGNASKLSVADGFKVSGDVAAKIKLPNVPEIAVHVVAQPDQPIDLTCDAHIPLKSIVPQLAGDLHVTYTRGGGANAFSLEATNIAVFAPPINGQVLFSKLSAHIKGNEITGMLTAAPGVVIKAGPATVTILSGFVKLLPGRKLDGQLKAQGESNGSTVEATVGWKNGKLDWAAEGDFDLGPLTSFQIIGKVHAAAGSNGTGKFIQNGEIKFAPPALQGIVIKELSGDKNQKQFHAVIDANQALAEVQKKIPGATIEPTTTRGTIDYAEGKGLTVATTLEGKASFPKTGPQLEGRYHISYDGAKGFTGKIDEIKFTASDYFKTTGGHADIETGVVNLGNATFEVPKIATGTVKAEINLKTSKFHVEADVDATAPALQGLKFQVTLDNSTLTAKLRANTPPIPLGKFATLTVGANSTVTLAKGTGLTADINGAVDAHGLGNGTFRIHYQSGQDVTGDAKVHVNPFAMFDAINLDMKLDAGRQLSTNAPVVLQLAAQYQDTFAADARVNVKNNQFLVEGHVTEVKNLGNVSDAFRKGGGAEIKWDQASHQVTVTDDFDLDTAIPELGEGSTLHMQYVGKVMTINGTLKPRSYGAVTFSPDSQITARWSSSDKRFQVSGQAQAEIAQLCTVDFAVDASLGGGLPGAFGLKGRIDATKLSQKIKGVEFSSVSADFSVLIGQGKRTDLNFHINAQISGIPAAGVTDISAHIDASYKSGQGISGELAVTRAKLGEVIADGRIAVANNKFTSGSVHLLADFPSLKIEGTGTVSAGEMGEFNTAADLKVTPGGGSALAKFVQSGNIRVDIQKWKLANAKGQLHLVPPSFLPIENPVIEVGYTPGQGIHATLTTQFPAPMAKNGEKGTFVAGYEKNRGLYAHIEFPITVPGFQAAKVTGDLDGAGIRIGATLIPKDATIVKEARVEVGYDFGGGFYIQGSITLKPTESLELVVGLRYDSQKGLQVMGITPNDKAATPEDHEIANWHKDFPTIPLASIGVASLGLKFGIGVAAGYRMPRIAFKNPQLEGGLEALDKGGMPAFTFGGSIAMGAYITLSLSVQVVGEIQLLIASCDAGIGAEIAARLNLELGADVNGRFAPGQGARLDIDPFVGASLDLIASLIATLHAEVCWFTIVDKKWTLASANFAHIELGRFHPFNPVGLQIGGPGGTHLTNGLSLRDDAFDQIKEGVKQGAQHAGDEEANRDARERVAPVLKAFRAAAVQFEQLPEGWQNGMVAPPVDFHSMFPVSNEQWDFYQDHADQAETLDPGDACTTPTQKLAKAVAVTARRDPMGAGRLILAWRRAQIAHMGINPDTGVNVVEERELVQAHIEAKYQAELLEAQQKQKQQDEEHAAHVQKQAADYKKAEDTHVQTDQTQKKAHETNVSKTQGEWNKAQEEKTKAAKHAKQEGAHIQPDKTEKAPPPAKPVEPPAPKPLAKPDPIPVPPPVPLPAPPEVLPAVTLPALPGDPGVSVHAAAAIPPTQKKAAAPPSPGAKQAPKGGTPDPMPGATSNAKQVGGGGGGPANIGGGNSGSKSGPSGGSTSAAPKPGPAVAAGPDGIISQQRTLDAKEAALSGKAAPGAPGKPGVLGKLPGAPTAAKPAAGGKPPAATPTAGATPGPAGKAPGAPGAATTDPKGAKTAPGAGGVDATVQKVVDQGKTDEAAYKQKLEQQATTYSTTVKEKDKLTAQETQRLEKEAEEAKKRKEREKAAADARAAAANGQAPALGPDGKPLDKKHKGPLGTRVSLNVDGESHTLYIEEQSGLAMVASTPTPVTAKVSEISGTVGGAPSIKPLAAAGAQQAKTEAQHVADLAAKANAGDEAANTALISAQQTLGGPLKITWAWAKVALDPAVVGGSIEKPLLHPYYPTFKGRVAQLSSAGHISVDATQFAESIWTKICQAVKAAHPAMNDPAAYSNFAKGWLNMKSPEFLSAIAQFDHIGKEMAKAGSAGFARARNFGFWSKDEGRSLAEAISDLTLETSAIGGLMDGLPTLDGKQAGWDPEIWGALSNAYATAVVPELLKSKKVNVCVGAGVPAGNIWDAVESAALAKGLKGTKLTLESVCTHYAAAAKTKANRRVLDDTKQTSGFKGCLFVGARPGAIAAADAHFKTLDLPPPVTAAQAGTQPGAAQPGAAQPGTEPAKPLPPGAPIGKRVAMTVGGEGHTQYIDPSGKPMVASTPTPVTSKLAELNAKLATLRTGDPKKAEATAEIARARGLEAKLAELATKVKDGLAPAADLEAQQQALAASVAKIWDIADPGVMDAAKAKEAVDSRATDCTDISAPLVADWVGKARAKLESELLDTAALRHAIIAKYISTGVDRDVTKVVGNKDPIAIQKFQDIESEKHLDPAHGDLKSEFFKRLKDKMVEPAFTNRERTYPVMKTLNGDYKFSGKGVKVPTARITPYAVRNQSVETLYFNANGFNPAPIDAEIATSMGGASPEKIQKAKANVELRKKAYRHLLKKGANPLTTIDRAKPIAPYATWYGPGTIQLDTSAPPDKEFARMMTLGALQPEWYPHGTVVLHIERKAEAAARHLLKPTAFDGLMSSLWCARNLNESDYGITGGGLGEFLEANVPFADVTSATAVIPSDDFLADIQRVSSEVKGKLGDQSTPTEELVRGNTTNTKVLNTSGTGTGGAKDMYQGVIDRSTQEQQNPSAQSPAAPGAVTPTSSAKPENSPVAPGGAYDTTNGPRRTEMPLNMRGEGHHLVLTSGPNPNIEMASTIAGFLGKVDKLLGELHAIKPQPTTQIGALTHLRSQAEALEHVLAAVVTANAAPGVKKQQDPSNSPEAQALVAGIVAYGNSYDATDLDILADPRTSLRKHPGYSWLATKGLATDFETRILTQLPTFTKARVANILAQIVRYQGIPEFEAKVVKAISENKFWSPNDGFFFEIEDLTSIANIRYIDVKIAGKEIDVLTGDGILIDQKYEVTMDPKDPTKLKAGILGQLAAMKGAVGTVINGIKVKDFRFHVRGGIADPQAQAYVAANGLTAHFVAR